MQEVTIKYENPKTLVILKDLAKYFDFVVSTPKEEKKGKQKTPEIEIVNGVTLIRGDSSIDIKELRQIFTGKNLDAKKLRQKWQRRK